MMFIQFFQFWFLRFAFLLAVVLFAFALSRCLAWIMNGKYRSLPVLGCNSLVLILPASHRRLSLNCYTAPLEPLRYQR